MTNYKTEIISTIPEKFIGKRVDVFLSDYLPDHSRTQIKNYISNKNVLINNKSFKPSRILTGNEVINISIPPPEPSQLFPQDLSIEVLYEDKDIIVVNKPANLTVHPGAGIKQGTLVNGLLFLCNDLSGIGGELRPGIVHRLDKETSGVIVAAKNDFSHRNLSDQFKSRVIYKKYICIVVGEIKNEEGMFNTSIERHKTNRIKMTSMSGNGRVAETKWNLIKRYKGFSYLEAEPKTGRTHQIRVHFADNGYPILHDKVYGNKGYKSDVQNRLKKLISRHALHAKELGFTHPRTNEYMKFEASIPKDMLDVIDFLES